MVFAKHLFCRGTVCFKSCRDEPLSETCPTTRRFFCRPTKPRSILKVSTNDDEVECNASELVAFHSCKEAVEREKCPDGEGCVQLSDFEHTQFFCHLGDADYSISKYSLPPKRKTFGTEVKTLYHITQHGHEIGYHGEMHRGSGGSVGGGIYFAETPEQCKRKAESSGYLIEARVLIGKCKILPKANFGKVAYKDLQFYGYDSVKATGFKSGDEYVVYNKDQVQIERITKMCP